MAFWIKKPGDAGALSEENEKKSVARPKAKDKTEDKKSAIKRIDNLRIPEKLKITLKSFGSQTRYSFLTKDLSATGVFVLCQNFTAYPFQPNSTLIEATIELVDPITGDSQNIDFIARIARVVEAHGAGAAMISGFGLRIIQMDFSHRQFLENFIASHGKPDLGALFGSTGSDEHIDAGIVTTTYGPTEAGRGEASDEQKDDEIDATEGLSDAV